MRRVIDVGRSVLSELEQESLLQRVLQTAQEITGARYAAIGVLDKPRRELEQFHVRGIDPHAQHAIGDLPRGRGVLGELIASPSPLRLADVMAHPHSYGFPVGHPAMHSFLGVPIMIRGEVWGNLYLTEKQSGEFDQADEEAVTALADWAGIAIEHARLLASERHRTAELQRAAHGLEAARAIALAIGGETDLDRVLELIVKRGRALVQARCLLILLREGEELIVVASAGEAEPACGQRIPITGSISGEALERRHTEPLADAGGRLRIASQQLGVSDASTGLIVPLVHRGSELGVLIAFDHCSNPTFCDDDERALRAFAASAATAVITAQTVAAERLREALAAAEGERRRWARELHDQTLQSLGGVRLLLAAAQRQGDLAGWQRVGDQAITEIEGEIANLRAIINDLRPQVLDELGLTAALHALAEHRRTGGLSVECELSPAELVLGAELETTVYRLAQEALTNVVKHARATTARVTVRASHSEVTVRVEDDGVGFDTEAQSAGFGMPGMRERVGLARGTVTTDSGETGTIVLARIPLGSLGIAARAG